MQIGNAKFLIIQKFVSQVKEKSGDFAATIYYLSAVLLICSYNTST